VGESELTELAGSGEKSGIAAVHSDMKEADRDCGVFSSFLKARHQSSDAASYAQVRARLERAGTPIGPLDTLIAAQAVVRKLVLVSNNQREFGRVAGLHIHNWAN